MSGNNGYQLVNGHYGPRAIITSLWSEAMARCLTEDGVVELELNQAKGWRGNDLSFLAGLPHLKLFEIFDFNIPNVEPIHCLHELKQLGLTTYCTTKIQFAEFPQLEDCSLEWGRRNAQSLFECKSLKRLFVNRYKGHDVVQFAHLTNLESLAILNSPIKNVCELGELGKLRHLRLAGLRCLTSLAGIEKLANLEELDINTCRHIGSIAEIGFLKKLRRLELNNDGNIESLKPLEMLNSLETMGFYGTTNIIDGDLSPLLYKKHLLGVSFQNRRHYSHCREDFGT